jgi:methylmalonyl-CoA/ethylmalonyl-CoA epimerase
MKVRSLSHVSIAVRDIRSSLDLFSQLLGAEKGSVERLESQGVLYAFLELPNVRIELIAPLDEDSNLNRFLEKRGEGLHHLSFAVNDLGKVLDDLSSSGVRLIDDKPRTGAEGARVAFLHPDSTGGVLIELEEE